MTTAAGTDAVSGRNRLVVTVRIGPPTTGDREAPCVPHEVWLVTESRKTFEIEQLLIAHCTRESHWPVEMTIKGNEASIDLGGETVPSNWFGREIVAFELSQPSFSRKTAEYLFRLSPCPRLGTASSSGGFVGEVSWRKAARSADLGASTDPAGSEVCTEERAYVPVPVAALPMEFENGGFRTTAFGDCAAVIDGTGGVRGYAALGATSGPGDATLQVVLSKEHALYVDIADDHFVGPSADPAADDHLQIWTSPESDSYMASEDANLSKPSLWSVRVADGRVFGTGSSTALASFERAELPGHVRLRVRLHESVEKTLQQGGFTVAYSDADPGQPQAVIATSRAETGNASSLGQLRAAHPGLVCRANAGTLVQSAEAKGREEPLYQL